MKKKKISAFGGILAVAMMAFMLVGIFYTPYDREAMEKAWERLKKYHYELF